MNDSQKKVFDILGKNPVVSVQDVARTLGKTVADVRYHLTRLEEDGFVEVIGEHTGGGRGRPVRLYRLGGKVTGNNLGLLCSALLKAGRDTAPDFTERSRIYKLAHYLAGEVPPDTARHLTHRLAVAIERLNQLHYQSRWEATGSGPRFVLGNCPYFEIIENNPELCSMDGCLLETLTGLSVEQTAKLELSPRGGIFCEFLSSSSR